jgi:hypothetical protein
MDGARQRPAQERRELMAAKDSLHAQLKNRLLAEPTPVAEWGNVDPWATYASADAAAKQLDPAAPSLMSLDPAARRTAIASHLARAEALQAEASSRAARARTQTDEADAVDIDAILADEELPLEQILTEEGLAAEDTLPGELDDFGSGWWSS